MECGDLSPLLKALTSQRTPKISAIAARVRRINGVNDCKVSRFSRSTHGVLEPETEIRSLSYLNNPK